LFVLPPLPPPRRCGCGTSVVAQLASRYLFYLFCGLFIKIATTVLLVVGVI
jgi:hypothetical protein